MLYSMSWKVPSVSRVRLLEALSQACSQKRVEIESSVNTEQNLSEFLETIPRRVFHPRELIQVEELAEPTGVYGFVYIRPDVSGIPRAGSSGAS